jgi:hypothetical protein
VEAVFEFLKTEGRNMGNSAMLLQQKTSGSKEMKEIDENDGRCAEVGSVAVR